MKTDKTRYRFVSASGETFFEAKIKVKNKLEWIQIRKVEERELLWLVLDELKKKKRRLSKPLRRTLNQESKK